MNKINILKTLLVVIITLGLVFVTTQVFAADDDTLDLSNTLQGESGTGSETEGGNGTGFGTEDGSGDETGKDNPSSSYPETDIPYAGIETSVLTIAAFITCAIIGGYTFMKLSEYSNI